MKNTAPEVYCTTRQAADMLHVSLRTVQLWVESGVLKAWKTDGGHRRLPLSSVQELIAERMGKGVVALPPQDGFNILVLEDDQDMLKLYRMNMSTWKLPIQVSYASSVYEALIVIGRSTPGLLITDLKMCGVDGFKIISLLRNDQALKHLGIVVVTGLSIDEIEDSGGLPSDITIFNKPLSFEELQGYVKACLAHRLVMER